tara:strand:+ start:170 stop:1075 length:906 start_codon:yes stop_codon:yes gene_type:complete
MAYLGRKGAVAPLTSGDIPDGVIEGRDIAFFENASGQDLSGTYSTERMYLAGRTGSAPNDYNYKLVGNIDVTGHLALGTIADDDVVITQDGTERTITGSGTLEAGNVLQDTHRTSLTDMTGELGSAVTGSPAINLDNTTGDLSVPKITNIDHWRLNSGFTGAADPISANFERCDTTAGKTGSLVGNGMAQSSGIWTFPATGLWWVHAQGSSTQSGATEYWILSTIFSRNSGSNWYEEWEGQWQSHAANARCGSMTSAFLKVTNTSTDRVKFSVQTDNGSETVFTNTSTNRFWFAFIKLSDI